MNTRSRQPWKRLKTSEVFVPNKNAVLFEKIRQSLAVVFGTEAVEEFENFMDALGDVLSVGQDLVAKQREAVQAMLGPDSPDMTLEVADDTEVVVKREVLDVGVERDVKPMAVESVAEPPVDGVLEQYKRCGFEYLDVFDVRNRCQYVDRSNNMAKHWKVAHKQPMPTGDGNGWTHIYLTAEEFDKKLKDWKEFKKSLK